MAVVATAGHVDHGKSALVRRLTGLAPDRLGAEQARGLTLDLGHTHLTLHSGRTVGIVDVPGHERYLGTTVSGIGPAGGVLFCVAADEGWSVQSEQHARACAALGLDGTRLVLVLTKTDRGFRPGAEAAALARLTQLGLPPAAVVGCSARTGAGIEEVSAALDDLCARSRLDPPTSERTRLWVDRCFTLPGVGTVVTGTLPSGNLRRGETVHTVAGQSRIRRLQRYGVDVEAVSGPDRVALNLAGASTEEVPRGTAVLGPRVGPTPAHPVTDRVDAEVATRFDPSGWSRSTLLSFGTATVSGRISPTRHGVRLTLPGGHPLWPDDRILVRDPGGRVVLGGLRVSSPRPEAVPPEAAPDPSAVGVAALLEHLRAHPLLPPDQDRLGAWGVTGADLRRLGARREITYLGKGLAFGSTAVAAARLVLESLPTEVTVSEVRQALGLSRAHTLALLQHTDSRGLTEPLPSGLRRLRRPSGG